jgi:hypothetical protein
MIRFLIGLILGVIIGALAVVVFSAMATFGNPFIFTPSLAPGQSVIHISVDEPYLNQQLAAVLAAQPEFANANPQLDLKSPNIAMLTASVETNAGGDAIKVRPTLTVQFRVENARVRTHVVGVNLGQLNVPTAVIRPQITELERTLEEQVNGAITRGLTGTGLRVVNVGATENALVVDLGQ